MAVDAVFACTECGAQQPRWLGRCPECGAGRRSSRSARQRAAGVEGAADWLSAPSAEGVAKPRALARDRRRRRCRASRRACAELDRVLGGGLVPGSVVLLAGEPGVGKSTLALQLAAGLGARRRCSTSPARRAPSRSACAPIACQRLPAHLVAAGGDARRGAGGAVARAARPPLVIVDSVQTLRSERVESAPGSVAQVRECAALLAAAAKRAGTALVLVGHVTREGTIAGPRVLEHLVDVVLYFEGDRGHAFRLLRAQQEPLRLDAGDRRLPHDGRRARGGARIPSELFLAERRAGAPGSCVAPLVEGSRPMLVEIQALVAPAGYGTARRTAIGIDDGRLALLLAVLDRRAGVDLRRTRRLRQRRRAACACREPGADLAIALALASSRLDLRAARRTPPRAARSGSAARSGACARLDLRVREARAARLPPHPGAGGRARRGRASRGAAGARCATSPRAVAWLRAQTPVHGARPTTVNRTEFLAVFAHGPL